MNEINTIIKFPRYFVSKFELSQLICGLFYTLIIIPHLLLHVTIEQSWYASDTVKISGNASESFDQLINNKYALKVNKYTA